MKVFLVFLCALVGGAQSAVTSCLVGADAASATATGCAGDTEKCKGPAWTEYTGYSATAFACGACAAEDTTCTDCDTDNCNTKVESTSYVCHKYVWDTDAWKTTEETTCKLEDKDENKDKDICNAPDRNSAKEDQYTIQLDGCGTCLAAQKTAKTCLECTGNKCNSSTTLSLSFLLTALAAVYYMM